MHAVESHCCPLHNEIAEEAGVRLQAILAADPLIERNQDSNGTWRISLILVNAACQVGNASVPQRVSMSWV